MHPIARHGFHQKKEGEREKKNRQTTCSTLKRLLTKWGGIGRRRLGNYSLYSQEAISDSNGNGAGKTIVVVQNSSLSLARSIPHSTLKNSIAPKQANAHQGRAGLPVRFQAHMSSIGDKKHLWDRHGT